MPRNSQPLPSLPGAGRFIGAWSWYVHAWQRHLLCLPHWVTPPAPGSIRHVEISSLDPRTPDHAIDDGCGHVYVASPHRTGLHRHTLQPDPAHYAECESCARGSVAPVRAVACVVVGHTGSPIRIAFAAGATSPEVTITEFAPLEP